MIRFAENLNKMITAGLGGAMEAPSTEVAVGHRVRYMEASGAVASFETNIAAPIKKLLVDMQPVQAGSGDPSPDNIRPITGRESVTVTRTGANLFDINGETTFIFRDMTIQNNKIVSSSIGNGAVSRVYFAKTYKPGTYTFSAKMNGQLESIRFFSPKPFAGGMYNSYYGGYFAVLKNGQTTVMMTEPFTVGVILSGTVGGQCEVYDIQLELGSTASDYKPYAGTIHTIQLGDTVYGGTLDVTAGMMTVEWANIASYDGETLPGEWISDRDAYAPGTTPTTGAQVCYKLATPLTIQLTPAQLSTLKGDNNVWSDAGDVTLEYPYYEETEGY